MELKNIAIVGAAGNVGSAIAKAIKNSGANLTVTALARATSTRTPTNIDSTVTVDFDDQESLTNALRGQDAVLCCVPSPAVAFAPQKLLIDSAIAAGVNLFFADEFVSDIMNPGFKLFPTQFVGDKVRVRAYLEEKAAAGEIAFTALNGGPFFDMWLMRGPAGFDIKNKKATIYSSGTNLVCWTPLPVIAQAAVQMLLSPGKVKNRAMFICGVQDLTQLSLLAALEAETGAKFEVEHVDLEPMAQTALEHLAKGEVGLALRGLVLNSNFNEKESKANFWNLVENDLLGVKPVTVREAVKQCLDDAKQSAQTDRSPRA